MTPPHFEGINQLLLVAKKALKAPSCVLKVKKNQRYILGPSDDKYYINSTDWIQSGDVDITQDDMLKHRLKLSHSMVCWLPS